MYGNVNQCSSLSASFCTYTIKEKYTNTIGIIFIVMGARKYNVSDSYFILFNIRMNVKF